ncbi:MULTISPECIES: DUF1905 domain-containing protein [unclassified Microbacterium]|jgi:hypothetical protein|uniref:DUF1905 domain-containing protein n=1 Tax=unclassified Microbacterium TaxID=2609290 RepID=UPI00041AC90A|nr:MULTISPECIES: DUF1905 domain-containing protein [unclassified Microbacterium]PQZ53698.1 DUF1905 domain-containing protein [Microbacterium sp. MYb43]PQZ76273.1 DUF1905 domain-containing protein [Microbacterium sp. MYb40]PRB21385.1 DUF1905 domain-containing protein [Microbacterium sp. MYb54]PRB29949.1 DUF1905 domain-containing protein [Microbacterium sp. MYb50]PRB67891.1 DUF1905 domain-containing protein [Microbacterium sp. MYb24]
MQLRIEGAIWFWRGPAPFHFVTVPPVESDMIHDIASVVTYGWGMIPASVTIGSTTVTTALWPKDGGYIVPIKKALQDREGLGVDDVVDLLLDIDA